MKEQRSITIDEELNKGIEEQRKQESRSFSNMIEHMARMYLRFINQKNDL